MTWTAARPALRRYFWRFGIAMTLYMVVLPVMILVIRRHAPAPPLLYVLAVVPALPILGVFYAIGRYVVEEHDEYLRARLIRQILYATAMMLAITTVWNFLANFTDVPPARWVGAIWLGCLGISAGIVAVEDW